MTNVIAMRTDQRALNLGPYNDTEADEILEHVMAESPDPIVCILRQALQYGLTPNEIGFRITELLSRVGDHLDEERLLSRGLGDPDEERA